MELNFQYTFAYQVYNKTITISSEESNTTQCCVDDTCPCSSLEMVLRNVSNDTLINVTSAKVALSVQTSINYVSKIGITGSNHTVIDCNNIGGVLFHNCGEICISDITLYQCGSNELLGAISLDRSHGISVEKCVFQSSNMYGIATRSLLGKMVVTDTKFLYNNKSSNNDSAGLYILETNPPMNFELVIIRSVFKYNGNNGAWQSPGGGVYVDILIPAADSSSFVNISVEGSLFMHNSGAGSIHVSADSNKGELNAVIH